MRGASTGQVSILLTISESEATEYISRTDSGITLTTRAPTPSDPVLIEFEDYLLD